MVKIGIRGTRVLPTLIQGHKMHVTDLKPHHSMRKERIYNSCRRPDVVFLVLE